MSSSISSASALALLPDRRLHPAGLDQDHVDALRAQLAPQRVAQRPRARTSTRCRRPRAAAPPGRRSSSRSRSARGRARSAGRNAWVTATWPIRLTSSCWRSLSIGRNSSGAATAMPALFTRPASGASPSSLARRRDLVRVGHVEPHGAQAAAPRAARRPRPCARRATASKPSVAQVERRRLADAGRGAGHEHGSGHAPHRRGAPYSASVARVDVEEAIRTRRTHKVYGPEPVAARDARRAVRARPLGAEPQPHEPVALPRARPGGARAPEGGGRARRRRRSSTARRRSWWCRWRRPATRCRTRRTYAPTAVAAYIVLLAAHAPRAGRLLAHARPCCAPRRAARRWACRTASGRSG